MTRELRDATCLGREKCKPEREREREKLLNQPLPSQGFHLEKRTKKKGAYWALGGKAHGKGHLGGPWGWGWERK